MAGQFQLRFSFFPTIQRSTTSARFLLKSHTELYDQMSNQYSSHNGDANNASGNQGMNVIRKKLMGYVGFANLPNQVHRKSVRKGFQFTAMVVGAWPYVSRQLQRLMFCICTSGESGLGKSTLINTLFNTTLYPPKEPLPPSAERPQTVAIESIGAGMAYTKIGLSSV